MDLVDYEWLDLSLKIHHIRMIHLQDSYNNFGSCIGIRALTGGGDDVVGDEIVYSLTDILSDISSRSRFQIPPYFITKRIWEFSMVWKIWTYQDTQPYAVELTVLLVTGNAAAIQIFFPPCRLLHALLIGN